MFKIYNVFYNDKNGRVDLFYVAADRLTTNSHSQRLVQLDFDTNKHGPLTVSHEYNYQGDSYSESVAIDGIDADNGFFGYVKGQLCENMGSTPLGCSEKMDVESALKIANIAEDYQKSLSTEMKTIHSVKEVLGTEFDEVTIEALDSITHTPAVIIRKI